MPHTYPGHSVVNTTIHLPQPLCCTRTCICIHAYVYLYTQEHITTQESCIPATKTCVSAKEPYISESARALYVALYVQNIQRPGQCGYMQMNIHTYIHSWHDSKCAPALATQPQTLSHMYIHINQMHINLYVHGCIYISATWPAAASDSLSYVHIYISQMHMHMYKYMYRYIYEYWYMYTHMYM